MNAIAFDTLRFAERLQAAGYSVEQSEAQAEAFSDAVSDAFVTKSDFDHGIELLRGDIEGAATLRGEIREANLTLIKWVVPLLVGQPQWLGRGSSCFESLQLSRRDLVDRIPSRSHRNDYDDHLSPST
jgi:hypothetical protein